MTEAIYKYELSDTGTAEVTMPKGAKILDFQYQRNGFSPQLVVWAIVNIDEVEHVTRRFRILATGQLYDFKGRKYKKTLQDDGGLVWHIFEILQ
jgi:hypothetical protein